MAKPANPRRRKMPVKLSSGWHLFRQSLTTFWQHRQPLLGITLVYGVLSLILVHGFGDTVNLSSLKAGSKFSHGGQLFNSLLGSSGSSSSPTASLYQSILLILASLAIIWCLRQLHAKKTVKNLTVKRAYYQSTYALIPFILTLLLISLQLIPLLAGAAIYSLVVGNGLAVGAIESGVWLAALMLLTIWSLYMLTASIFSLYIVTLPDMSPLVAWRSARKLVAKRRWTVMRKLVFLPIILLMLTTLVTLPFAVWLAPVAEWVFFAVGVLVLPLAHIYLYSLYRELL